MIARRIPLYDRAGCTVGHALVDRDDYARLNEHRWNLSAKGYAQRTYQDGSRRRIARMNREILGLKHGDKRQAEHKNRNRLDNRRLNLRVATNAQNAQNRSAAGNQGTTSRFRGVSKHKDGKWLAQVYVDGKQNYLGLYQDEEEAGRVTAAARKRLMAFATT